MIYNSMMNLILRNSTGACIQYIIFPLGKKPCLNENFCTTLVQETRHICLRSRLFIATCVLENLPIRSLRAQTHESKCFFARTSLDFSAPYLQTIDFAVYFFKSYKHTQLAFVAFCKKLSPFVRYIFAEP